jgi:ring-1,2-phenylacetyl-CoA epoxidase subunit PaaE
VYIVFVVILYELLHAKLKIKPLLPYFCRKLILMASYHSLTIKTIKKETHNAVSIEFVVPNHLKSDFNFEAGQYVTLKTTINGAEVRRDYSICTAPIEGVLKVVVKEVENGTFSTFANNELTDGDVLEVAPPNGRFVLDRDNQQNIALLAAGSGITPVISILKAALLNTPSKILLVYGNKSPDDTIFKSELDNLQNQHNDRLNIQYVYSQSDEENALFGRIDKSAVNFVLRNKFSQDNYGTFYLCGPEQMIDIVKSTLLENGVDESNILFELITASTSELKNTNLDGSGGNAQITVLIDDEEEIFEMPKTKTILESALEANIDAPYSCQGGVCSSCIAKIISGKAEMRLNNILTDNELEEGYVLTCQAQPVSDTIYIDYDDV